MMHRGVALAQVWILALLLAACSSSSGSASPTATAPRHTAVPGAQLTVGLVTDVGGLHDRSFNQFADRGLTHAATRWHVKTSVLQSGSESEYAPNLERMVRDKVGLIIAVGFSMRSAVYTVATQHPEARFALVDAAPVDAQSQLQNLPNVANLFFKEQESGYLVGVIAGEMERHHVGKATTGAVGYLGGTSIPEVNRYLAGYVAGIHRVDPGLRVVGEYAGTYSNDAVGRQIGERQIGEGADILFQVAAQTGLGYLAAAEQHGLYGIGVDADQGYLSRSIITSAVKRVDVAVQLIIHDVITGAYTGGDHRYGLKEGATGFAPPSSVVPAGVVRSARLYAAQIAHGDIVPPTEIPRY